MPTAKRIFGDKFDAFQSVNSDEQKREELRADVLSTFVKEHGLTATLYQDYGGLPRNWVNNAKTKVMT